MSVQTKQHSGSSLDFQNLWQIEALQKSTSIIRDVLLTLVIDKMLCLASLYVVVAHTPFPVEDLLSIHGEYVQHAMGFPGIIRVMLSVFIVILFFCCLIGVIGFITLNLNAMASYFGTLLFTTYWFIVFLYVISTSPDTNQQHIELFKNYSSNVNIQNAVEAIHSQLECCGSELHDPKTSAIYKISQGKVYPYGCCKYFVNISHVFPFNNQKYANGTDIVDAALRENLTYNQIPACRVSNSYKKNCTLARPTLRGTFVDKEVNFILNIAIYSTGIVLLIEMILTYLLIRRQRELINLSSVQRPTKKVQV